MNPIIRLARPEDANQMLKIYSPFVTETLISFELEPPTLKEFQNRLTEITKTFPWIVVEVDGVVAGYAYASEYRARKAYQWSVDVSVYIGKEFHRQGFGKLLYQKLFELLKAQGYFNAFAGITLPNEASVKLHESFGFELIGVYRDVGFKFGAWSDVGWWQLRLQNADRVPDPLITFPILLSQIGRNFPSCSDR